jgi:hypothetical protein
MLDGNAWRLVLHDGQQMGLNARHPQIGRMNQK